MTRERLLEILTGEKEPLFVSKMEYVIIDKCLLIINSLEEELELEKQKSYDKERI